MKSVSVAKLKSHPWIVTGVVALVVGAGAFAAYHFFSKRKGKEALRVTAAPQMNGKHEVAQAKPPTGLIVDMLTNAARAWIVHSLTQPPPPPPPQEPVQSV